MGKFTKRCRPFAKKPGVIGDFPNVLSKEKLIPHTGRQIAACAVGMGAIKFEDFVGTIIVSTGGLSPRKAAI